MLPFVPGQLYERAELLGFVGSKQPISGIIYGPSEPGCVICTSGGRHSQRVGYEDGPSKDGQWTYIGQGGSGDQKIGRKENRLLSDGLRTVLMFRTREPTAAEVRQRGSYRKLYEFIGGFQVVGRDVLIPSSGPRKGDRLIRFHLAPVLEGLGYPNAASDVEALTLVALRDRAVTQSHPPAKGESLASYRKRCLYVRLYALARAAGTCEWCSQQAPFVDSEERPFLEVHHIQHLADDGPDHPTNVAALCPNCHRMTHFAKDRLEINKRLEQRILKVEEALESASPK